MSNFNDHVKRQILEKPLLLQAPTGALYVIVCHNSHPGQKEDSNVVYFQAFIQADIGHWYQDITKATLCETQERQLRYDIQSKKGQYAMKTPQKNSTKE